MSTALVTGANRGIGLELVRQLQAKGLDVIATCRSSSDSLDELETGTPPVRVETGVDVASNTSVAEFGKKLGAPKIDLLVLNAGVMNLDVIFDLSIEKVQKQIEVNALGPLRVVAALVDKLGEGSKIVIITSQLASIENNNGGLYGYRMSKAAVNQCGRSLARDLEPRGVAVAMLHPGFVATDMNAHQGPVSAETSVRGLLEQIAALSIETTGQYRDFEGAELPW